MLQKVLLLTEPISPGSPGPGPKEIYIHVDAHRLDILRNGRAFEFKIGRDGAREQQECRCSSWEESSNTGIIEQTYSSRMANPKCWGSHGNDRWGEELSHGSEALASKAFLRMQSPWKTRDRRSACKVPKQRKRQRKTHPIHLEEDTLCAKVDVYG